MVDRLKSHYKIILFDNVGAGKSDLSAYDFDKYSTLQGYASDVIEILEDLSLGKVTFVGHSVGATIGMLAVAERPELFTKLIMIGPSPRYVNDPPYIGGFEQEQMEGILGLLDSDYRAWANTFGPIIMGNPERPELGEELIANFCSINPEIAKHFGRVTFLSDNREDVPKVKIPTMILQCSEDVIAPVEVGNYLTRHMPVSSLHVLQAKGHCPHLSFPDEVAEKIRSFV
jgi:sigma-B regulation protein RsbQ